MSASPHITAVKRQAKLKRLATEKFRVANGKVETYKTAPPAQDIAAVVAAAIVTEIANAEPGQMIGEHGIFLGTWELKDKEGNSLSKTFNVFAAPRDLVESSGQAAWTYENTLKVLSKLRNWRGHDGAVYEKDTELYAALKSGGYNGEWVIPPYELLKGQLFGHKNAGSLKDTFGQANNNWYWSSTEGREPSRVRNINLKNGDELLPLKDGQHSCCRPVRLELKP